MKKVGKTTRPFMYDLNQIHYDYTMKVRNRFKGLDLIDTVPGELWMEVCGVVQETVIKNIPKRNKCKKAKGLALRWVPGLLRGHPGVPVPAGHVLHLPGDPLCL